MNNILSLEFFRLKRSKLFWALFGVCAGLPLVSMLLTAVLVFLSSLLIEESLAWSDIWLALRQSNMTGSLLSSLPSVTGDCAVFALICSSIFVSGEFKYGTYRNMLLANRSRLEIYFSYLIMAVTIGASYMTASFVTSLLFGGAIFGFGTVSALTAFTEVITSFTMGLISVLFVQSMMCMFLFVTRKLSVGLTCPLLICILLPSVIMTIVQVVTMLLTLGGNVVEADLSWIPIYNSTLLDLSGRVDGEMIGKILLYELPLTAFFVGMGWVGFRKADLK